MFTLKNTFTFKLHELWISDTLFKSQGSVVSVALKCGWFIIKWSNRKKSLKCLKLWNLCFPVNPAHALTFFVVVWVTLLNCLSVQQPQHSSQRFSDSKVECNEDVRPVGFAAVSLLCKLLEARRKSPSLLFSVSLSCDIHIPGPASFEQYLNPHTFATCHSVSTWRHTSTSHWSLPGSPQVRWPL